TFYFPKLLLLDPDLTDDALELIRDACEEYGFDRLLLTKNPVDRRMLQLLQSRSNSQLILYMMNQRLTAASRTVRMQRSRLKKLNRRPVKVAKKFYKYAVVARRAAREGAPRKFLLALKNVLDSKPNGYWLFMDRRDKAGDNAEALYRYVRENKLHDKIAFVIRDDCPDYKRLQRDGFNLVTYNSFGHWRLLYNCEIFFASHVDDVIVTPWKEYQTEPLEAKYRLVFLQHGIISSDLSGWLGEKTYHVFCSTTRSEYEALLNNIAYRLTPDTLKLTGLARHDLLEQRPGDYILVSPTWRSFLTKATNAEFRASEFYSAWNDLVYSEQLRTILDEAGLHIKFALHPSLDKFRQCFEETGHVKLVSYQDIESYSDLISRAQALVTDYSTISFDALYIRRPVIYYTFPETRTHSTNLGRDTDLYRNLGFPASSHDEAVNAIVTSARQNFKLDDEKVREIDDFFAFRDNANRKRIIEAVQQKEHRA
ncbi:MAG TPA: CDP-glycerol glycerophosphotransferase family protein, partial [Nitrospira sp.]|nr:CDP-glycerol glycerophosphotransferase family protein [Nitrospira sp.]